jgi:hypothetical protein
LVVSRARKTPPPPSWLNLIRSAAGAFTASAQVKSDDHVEASATAFRGDGWRVTAEVRPQAAVVGESPAAPVSLSGDTPFAPDQRIDLGRRFPPDTLRRVPYWDCARSGTSQIVLVVVGGKPFVALLEGSGDDLVGAVRTIRDWVELPQGERVSRVLSDLRYDTKSAVLWNAGAELVLTDSLEPAGALSDLLAVPGRPPGALAAVEAAMPPAPGAEITAAILGAWATSTSPEDQAASLAWFENNRPAWETSDHLARQVRELARQAADQDSDDGAWGEEISRFAAALLSAR